MNNLIDVDNFKILEYISGEDALAILRILITKNKELKTQVEKIARNLMSNVSIDAICDNVYSSLNYLHVEDVWDNSGSSRYGYNDPGDVAWEMFENVIESFWEEMKKCQELGMDDKAILYCIGILKGIEQFEIEPDTEFADWAVDAPAEFFDKTFDIWKNGCKNFGKNKEKLEAIIKKNYPELQQKIKVIT